MLDIYTTANSAQNASYMTTAWQQPRPHPRHGFNEDDILDDETLFVFGRTPYMIELRSIAGDKETQGKHWEASDMQVW